MNLPCTLLLLCMASTAFGVANDTPLFMPLGTFPVPDASFVNIDTFRGDAKTSIIISSFSGGDDDAVYIVKNATQYFPCGISDISTSVLTSNVTWPNEVERVPDGFFDTTEEMVCIGDGFLPPGKRTGAIGISIIDKGGARNVDGRVSHTIVYDVNGDGLQDIVSARTYQPPVGKQQGELVYFLHPSGSPWEMTVLAQGPDILQHFAYLDGPNAPPALIATQFFTETLAVWWPQDGNWSNPHSMQQTIVDQALGAPFDSQVVDLNKDGNMDVLVSNHEHDAPNSAVFAYEIPAPDSWRTQPWKRHVLTSNITTLKIGPNQASPGNAVAFYPNLKDTNGKPWILLSGDGSEYGYILTPDSEDPTEWSYTRHDIEKYGCTVGQIAVTDIDGDGWSDFLVPAYEKGTIHAYTFNLNVQC